jgi:hypothetical protein
MEGFWSGFKNILGPQGFEGFEGKDFWDKKRWEQRELPWQNPNTMRKQVTYDYIPRGGKPRGSVPTGIMTTGRPYRGSPRPMPPQAAPKQRLDPRQQMMIDLNRDQVGQWTTPLPNKPQLMPQMMPPIDHKPLPPQPQMQRSPFTPVTGFTPRPQGQREKQEEMFMKLMLENERRRMMRNAFLGGG